VQGEHYQDQNYRVPGQFSFGRRIHDPLFHYPAIARIEAASDSLSEQHDKQVKKSGLFSGGGIALTIGASGNRGDADGEDITHTHTRVDVGNTLTLDAGADTTLRGAIASGKQVIANVGGDLNIESLQDTSTYTVGEKSLSLSYRMDSNE
jgi:hypothetical protein